MVNLGYRHALYYGATTRLYCHISLLLDSKKLEQINSWNSKIRLYEQGLYTSRYCQYDTCCQDTNSAPTRAAKFREAVHSYSAVKTRVIACVYVMGSIWSLYCVLYQLYSSGAMFDNKSIIIAAHILFLCNLAIWAGQLLFTLNKMVWSPKQSSGINSILNERNENSTSSSVSTDSLHEQANQNIENVNVHNRRTGKTAFEDLDDTNKLAPKTMKFLAFFQRICGISSAGWRMKCSLSSAKSTISAVCTVYTRGTCARSVPSVYSTV